MWVVSLPVPTSLRATLKNTRGKPLTRLERSTGERDEGRARRAYPKLLAELEAELQQKSKDAGLNTTIQEAVERAIGKIYEDVVSDEQSLRSVTRIGRQLKTKGGNLSPHSAPKNRLNIKPVEAIDLETTQRAAQMSRLLAGELLRRKGLSLSGPELELAEKSLKWAMTEAGIYGGQIQEIGYLAKETEAGKSLREAANKAKPISIWDAAEHKLQWNGLS